MTNRIGIFRDTRLPACRCPYCDQALDAAMAADPKHPDASPKDGDVTICLSCASILVFTETLSLRKPELGEIELTPALRRAQEAVRRFDRRSKQ